MGIRNYISIGLLIAFVVLLTPREWWHECDHHSADYNSGTVQIDQDDCAVCDYHIAVWAKPIHFFELDRFEYVPLTNSALLENHFLTLTHNFNLRGPPVS